MKTRTNPASAILTAIDATMPPVRDAGDSYDNARRKAEAIAAAIKTESDPAVLRALRGALEQARYVGD